MVEFPEPSEAKIRLFIGYSRFEFALKEAGYLARGKGGIARAAWERFADDDCLKDVMDMAALDADVRELIAMPPLTQVTDDGDNWHWEQRLPRPLGSLSLFFVAVKGVRDNLFHGGKHGDDPRDDVLCRAAWVVLELCLERHHGVRNAFEGKY